MPLNMEQITIKHRIFYANRSTVTFFRDVTTTVYFFMNGSQSSNIKNKLDIQYHNNPGQHLPALPHTTLREQLEWTQSQYSGG